MRSKKSTNDYNTEMLNVENWTATLSQHNLNARLDLGKTYVSEIVSFVMMILNGQEPCAVFSVFSSCLIGCIRSVRVGTRKTSAIVKGRFRESVGGPEILHPGDILWYAKTVSVPMTVYMTTWALRICFIWDGTCHFYCRCLVSSLFSRIPSDAFACPLPLPFCMPTITLPVH